MFAHCFILVWMKTFALSVRPASCKIYAASRKIVIYFILVKRCSTLSLHQTCRHVQTLSIPGSVAPSAGHTKNAFSVASLSLHPAKCMLQWASFKDSLIACVQWWKCNGVTVLSRAHLYDVNLFQKSAHKEDSSKKIMRKVIFLLLLWDTDLSFKCLV